VGLKQPLALGAGTPERTAESGNLLALHLTDAASGIRHDKLRLDGQLYDALQVVLSVPAPAGGAPRLLSGKLVFESEAGRREVRFPILADGTRRVVTVHPPQALIKAAGCRGCAAQCRNSGTPQEGWYDSCSGALIRAGACKSKEGLTLCGPYCTGHKDAQGQTVDQSLQPGDPEGWYDSCKSLLDGVYRSLTLLPVAGPEAASLGGPVLVDRIDLFKVSELTTLEEARKKDGEKDGDGDGLINAFDNCPTVVNPDQLDSNQDGKGDACGDFDSDGVADSLDNCPTVVNSLQQDDDGDGIGNACDPDHEAGGCGLVGGRPALGLLALGAVLLGLALRRARRR
jgi:hypothetical protein